MHAVLNEVLSDGARGGTMHAVRFFRSALLSFILLTLSMAWAQWPLLLIDELGREVRLEGPPQRIISMVPSHTEKVCALGACERLVGRDTWSDHPAEVLRLPDLGSAFSPDLEALVALKPDLVLVDQFSGAAQALEALGLSVYAGTPQTLEALFEYLSIIGAMLGEGARAEALVAAIRGEMAAISATVIEYLAGAPAPRVFYEVDPSPYSVGPSSFIGGLLELAGAQNIVPGGLGDFPLLDPELIVLANPEVILLADAPYGVSAASLLDRPGWAQLAAVRDGRVVEFSQVQTDLVSRTGPRVAQALRVLAEALHPGAF
jgi:iron complex transport system substrate-binding protein